VRSSTKPPRGDRPSAAHYRRWWEPAAENGLFVEVKGKEPLNDDQLMWLEAALDLQVPATSVRVLRYKVDGDAA
jgi:hypothetical protein